MSRIRSMVINILLLKLSLLLALGVTEALVRLVAPQPTGLSLQDRYGLALHWPGITRCLPQFGHEATFNSAGMRDHEHAIAKPDGVFRVVLLGDSFIEALQVPFEASLPSLLERQLAQATGRRVEVISAGVSGWGTDDALRWLGEYGLRYRPDLVLVAMTLHNDFSDNLRQEWHRLDGDSLITVQHVPMARGRYAIVKLKAYVATRLQTYQLWRRVRHGEEMRHVAQDLNHHVVQLFETPSPPAIEKAATITGLLLRRVRDVGAAAGARTAIVLIPLRYQLSDTSFDALRRQAGPVPGTMQLDRPQQLVRQSATPLGIPVVDLLGPFRAWAADSASALYLEGDGHWTEAGHRLAAGFLAEQLVAEGLVPAAR